MKERVAYIDNLKAFAIVCVILGHALQYLAGSNPERLISFNLIYTFHMPLFMMISGFFASQSFHLSPIVFFTKKFIQLFLPAISWSFVKIILSGGGNIYNNLTGSFWFLKSAFVCYAATYIMTKIIRKKKLAYIILFVIPLFCNIDISTYMLNYMLPSFIFGIWLRQNINYIIKHKSIIVCVSLLIYLALLPLWHFEEFHYTSEWSNGTFLIKEFLVVLHRIAIGLSGSLILFIIFTCINKTSSIMSNIGASTLGLYVMNGLFSDIQRHIVHLHIDNELACLAIALLLTTIQVPVFLFVISYMKKYCLFSTIFFGTTK